MRYRKKMLRTRKACKDIDTPGGLSPGWVCPPTHVPWTSGSIGVKADLSTKWQTGGGWGNKKRFGFLSLHTDPVAKIRLSTTSFT